MSGYEPIPNDYQRLVDLWRNRLLDARAKYDLAATQSKTSSKDFADKILPTPDGGAKMIGAIRAESRARSEYMRTLRIFTDLVIAGKAPEGDDPWRNHA
jgi:hypothetical protein